MVGVFVGSIHRRVKPKTIKFAFDISLLSEENLEPRAELSAGNLNQNQNRFDVCLMVVNATFNNISVISWRSALLVEETGGPGENHRPVASH